MGNYSSALTADIEDFDAIVSVSETLNQLATHVTDERLQSQILLLAAQSSHDLQEASVREDEKDNRKAEHNLSSVTSLVRTQIAPTSTTTVLPVVEEKLHPTSMSANLLASSSSSGARVSVPHNFPTLHPGALSAVLRATLPPHLSSDPKPRKEAGAQGPVTLEQLRTELLDLREEVELMKIQHNKEIQLLMNELDEEKRVRLSLQMEVAQMKKNTSKCQKHLSK
ncbi:hypothetical protein UPYG_G00116650 [Umbra pygmaea]|uniref:SH3 domain-containing kinase-binding protein 1-like n=1 Tax=Umbra pygmaea TaxID=75934 RepID=A0ABD0X4V1_UMBPY